MLLKYTIRTKTWLVLVIFTLVACSSAQEVDECNVPRRGEGTSGLLEEVLGHKGTIGYAGLDAVMEIKSEEDESDTCFLKLAKMKNKNGRVIAPSVEGAQAAVRSKSSSFQESSCRGFGLCADIYDGSDSDVWPLSTLTYLIVPTNATEEEEGCDKMKAVYDYLRWIFFDDEASAIAREQSMASMPYVVALDALAVLDQMQCRDSDGVVRWIKDRPTHASSLEGGGSSLQGVLQTKLTNAYFQKSFISISYSSSSSGSGRSALRNFELSFSGSDSILDMSDPEFARRGMKMIPAFAAAVALVYNADASELVLTRQAVAGIFTGDITSWTNPAILDENPDAQLKNDAIIRIVRSEKSGTTQALTTAIYAFDDYPLGSAMDYSLHVLSGSSFPDWPVPSLPYADGAECSFRRCVKIMCTPGQRYDVDSESCVPCAKGYFFNERGQQTECQACPPGTYASTEGNTKCAKCDDTGYQDDWGQPDCKPCPARTRRFFLEVTVGNTTWDQETPGQDIDECKCTRRYWLPAAVNKTALGGLECVFCPEGATCEGFLHNKQSIPQPNQDYWGDPTNPGRFIECAKDFCKPNYACEEGHIGRLCADAAPDYYTVGGLWYRKCPESQSLRNALVLVVLVCILIFWFKLRTLCFSNLDAFAVAVHITHAFYMISRMRLRWHPTITAATAVMALFNYDVAFFGWQCVTAGWGGVSIYFIQLFLPFILTGLSVGLYYWRWYFEMRSSSRSRDKNVRSKWVIRNPNYLPDSAFTYMQSRLFSFIFMRYHTIVMYTFAPFLCKAEPDGRTEYLSLFPDVQCNSPGHQAMRIFSLLYIMIIIIPVPIIFCSKLHKAMKKDVLNVYNFMEQYGFMYLKYQKEVPWWELVLLARKGLLGIVLVLVPVPMLQAVVALLIINASLVLHLVWKPMVHKHAAKIEVAGLFSSMFMTVCGMLSFPSLDTAVECVGAGNLVETIGEQCKSNEALKGFVAVLLLLLFMLLGASAVLLSVMEVHARYLAEKAALHMKLIMQHQRERGIGVDGQSISPRHSGSVLRDESSTSDQVRQMLREESWNPVWVSPKWWHGLAYRLGLRKQAPITTKDSIMDPYTLKLCHMIQGYNLHWWEQRVNALENSITTRWDRVREALPLHQEELAYIQTDESVAKFATIYDHVSGFYVHDSFANKLHHLQSVLPLLIDWLAFSDESLRADFCIAIQSLTLHCHKDSSRAYYDVVLCEFRAPVLHWLMGCSAEQRRSFQTVFTAISASAGLSTGKAINLGLGVKLPTLGGSPMDVLRVPHAQDQAAPGLVKPKPMSSMDDASGDGGGSTWMLGPKTSATESQPGLTRQGTEITELLAERGLQADGETV